MAAPARSETGWDERAARARLLASRHPSAAEVLTFYAALTEYQKSLAARWARAIDIHTAESFPECVDEELILEAVPDLVSWLQRTAPRGVVDAIPRDFAIEILLRPWMEQRAAARTQTKPQVGSGSNRCPCCGFPPVVGVLREEAEGARRSLVCALCLTEWSYRRLICPACGERRFDALPVYTAEQFPNARLDACETCRKYLKTIDATKDGLAIPVVDDIASLSLDLWARDRGYVRLQPNLLRL
jgi:FdhE protein